MTNHLLVVGSPVAHSRSPAMHNAAFAALGMDAVYDSMEVDSEGLRHVADQVREDRLDGVNITMPHKRAAFELSDRAGPVAERIRSVNTWIGAGGVLEGRSTDGAGVRHAWTVAGLPSGGAVLVLGAGGAARAAADELAPDNDVTVAARRASAADEVASMLGVATRRWGLPLEGAVVVNATPLGMDDEGLPAGVLDVASGYFEMVYGDLPTAAESTMRERGLPVATGREMLLGQAMASFELWFGVPAPEAAMRTALTRKT